MCIRDRCLGGVGGFTRDPDLDTPDMMNPTPQDITLMAEIAAMAVGTTELATDAVTNAKLADNAVQTDNIMDLNVTTGKLAADAVTNAKLADNAVQTENITDLHVTTGKLAADAVTNAKLADNAVLADNIMDGVITNAKLATPFVAADAVGAVQATDFRAVQLHSTTMPTTLNTSVLLYSVHLDPSGTGTITTTVPIGAFEGQTINVTATRGMTITWSGTTPAISRGIGLATSARIASGIWRDGGWYFSETVVGG